MTVRPPSAPAPIGSPAGPGGASGGTSGAVAGRRPRPWRRLVDPLLALLTQGTSPGRLAMCVAIGIVVGNVPVLGTSTVLCTLIAVVFQLNLPAIQAVQAAMAPTQLLLIIPFVRLGERLMHAPPQPLSLGDGLAILRQGALHAVVVLWDAIVHAAVAWALVAPFAVALLYRILTPVFARVSARLDRESP